MDALFPTQFEKDVHTGGGGRGAGGVGEGGRRDGQQGHGE